MSSGEGLFSTGMVCTAHLLRAGMVNSVKQYSIMHNQIIKDMKAKLVIILLMRFPCNCS
jgi:hypothetical protein